MRKFIQNYFQIYNQSKIYCTHHKVPHIVDAIKPELLVFDESPENILVNIKEVLGEDIRTVIHKLNNIQSTPAVKKLLKFYTHIYTNSVYDTVFAINEHSNTDFSAIFSEDDFNDLDISSPVFELIHAANYIVDSQSKNILFENKFTLPDHCKIIILSATPNIETYQQLCGDRVELIEFAKPVLKGKVYQIKDYSYSKMYFNKKNY